MSNTPISLVTVDELADLLEKESGDVCLVDARPLDDYVAGHIPGAISIMWESWTKSPPERVKQILRRPGYWGTLRDPGEFDYARNLVATGVRTDQRVIVYADGASSRGREGRIAWMLLYLGAPSVSLLDGTFSQWVAKKKPVETGPPAGGEGHFPLDIKSHRRLETATLADKLDTNEFPLLLDTRTKSEFNGLVFWYQPRMGRMPSSSLVVYKSMFRQGGNRFITAPDYKNTLPDNFVSRHDVGTYCEVGVRACTVALLHELYTGQVLPVYDGSIMEWSLEANLPVYR